MTKINVRHFCFGKLYLFKHIIIFSYFKFIFAIFIFVVVIAFAEGAGFQQTCKQNTDCTSVTGDIVCDVRPPIPTFTCLYKGGITCSQYMDCANNLNCSGVNVVNVTTNGICGCDAVNIFKQTINLKFHS